jgi:hypothetical protein
MPLDDDTFGPNAQTVLFHLTLFGEFCEDDRAEGVSAAAPCECLRDAVEELCQSLTKSTLAPQEQAALVTALHQAEASFRENMPDLFGRTAAARGFCALMELVNVAASTEHCFDLERRSTALGVAQRFAKTLGTFVAPLRSDAAHYSRPDGPRQGNRELPLG